MATNSERQIGETLTDSLLIDILTPEYLPDVSALQVPPAAYQGPYLEIREQPKQRGFRFRYPCEGPSHAGLPGQYSEKGKKSYPSVQLNNYRGPARIVVSLVTVTEPHMPHAHSLIGKNSNDGVVTVQIGPEHGMTASFPNLGIQHVTRKSVSKVLMDRYLKLRTIRTATLNALTVDSKGFDADAAMRDQSLADGYLSEFNKNVFEAITEEGVRQMVEEQKTSMNLSAVRMCFQAYLPDESGCFTKALPPCISDPVFDSKAPSASNLKICSMYRNTGCVTGNDEVYLLCDKVQKDDIEVVFYETEPYTGKRSWEAQGIFSPTDVHRQVAIVFKTPAYWNVATENPVKVHLELRRKSDSETSEPVEFTYQPQMFDKKQIGVKRRKKTPHFSDYLSGGGDGPPSEGGDGGGGFADFSGFGLFPTFNFMGLPGPSNQGDGSGPSQQGQSTHMAEQSSMLPESDKKQIGVKRRKKTPHFSDYLSGGGDGPPSVGGDGGGGFADFSGFGLFPTFNFMGLPGPSNQGVGSGTSQMGQSTISGETQTAGQSRMAEQSPEVDLVPAYVRARGEKALAAYHRALATGGSTCDKRVKVLLVGQDRVGKTSLGKALRGEPFIEAELSTDGVQMIPAVKNAGTGAWRNPASLEHTTVFDHKIAAKTAKDLLRTSAEEPAKKLPTEALEQKRVDGDPKQPTTASEERLQVHEKEDFPRGIQEKSVPRNQDQDLKKTKKSFHVPREKVMPDDIAVLLTENLKKRKFESDEKIWPVIWDFAGQDIYRAIHPVFLSPEDIYLLVFDLTKKLSEKAVCRVNVGHKEHIVAARDDEDTNLDHLLRWMDLIHSFKKGNQNEKETVSFPPVILVGTHADCVDDPSEQMELIKQRCSRVFCKDRYLPHIIDRLSIDNTKAGKSVDQHEIEKLRGKILEVADKMPHTKRPIPLQWHRVEKEIRQPKWQRRKFLSKESFREEIVSPFCSFEKEDDFDELVHFLHSRGTIVYHEHENDEENVGLVILDPQWLIKIFGKIINVNPQENEPWCIETDREELAEKGILSGRLINYICEDESLISIKDCLISLMDKFNLICKLPVKTGESHILVPCMLRATHFKDKEIETGSPVPIFLTFHTEYVPSGLFSRLIVLFVKDPQFTNMYKLDANEARFALDNSNNHFLQLVCYKTVIKLHIFGKADDSPPQECYECVLSRLSEFLEKLRTQCHWLQLMSERLCARCTVCVGEKTEPCLRHEERSCRHHDCSHYIPLDGRALCCDLGPGKMLEKESLMPWIKAIEHLKACPPETSAETTPHKATVKSAAPFTRTVLNITLLGDEWASSAGGLSTFNRELAIHLSYNPAVKVSLLVPEGACTLQEKQEADSYKISVVEARAHAAFDRLDWLSFPPKDHVMDVVVGHGVKLGRQGQVMRNFAQFPNFKWVQVVHTAPEDLSKYKRYADPISRGETKHQAEVELCKLADLVVPVGPRLKEAYSSYLKRFKADQKVFPITPGLFHREFGDLTQSFHGHAEFKVLLFGRGDDEDFELKGYNIAAQAFTDQRLKNKPYHLIFVGAPEGKQEEVREKLIQHGIAEAQLTVRKFIRCRDRMKDLLCEADLAIMPSKSEGFGLVALEALSAGLPILVGSRSGFAKALENVPYGNTCIVYSDDPVKWAEAIEAVRIRHAMRLQEMKVLRASYRGVFSWSEQCNALVERMWKMVHG